MRPPGAETFGRHGVFPHGGRLTHVRGNLLKRNGNRLLVRRAALQKGRAKLVLPRLERTYGMFGQVWNLAVGIRSRQFWRSIQ